MAIALTDIFGSQIKVMVQPRQTERTYTGFPAAHGVTTMWMGSRGRPVTVAGRIVTSVTTYALARVAAQAAIDAIEAYLWAPAADYSFNTCVFYATVWDSFRIVPDSGGKAFHWCTPGYIVVDFIMEGRTIL
jgi:hypothetical protein